MVPRTHGGGKKTGMELTYNPSAGEEEAGELWGLLASQPSRPHEFQAREISCLRKVSWGQQDGLVSKDIFY